LDGDMTSKGEFNVIQTRGQGPRGLVYSPRGLWIRQGRD